MEKTMKKCVLALLMVLGLTNLSEAQIRVTPQVLQLFSQLPASVQACIMNSPDVQQSQKDAVAKGEADQAARAAAPKPVFTLNGKQISPRLAMQLRQELGKDAVTETLVAPVDAKPVSPATPARPVR
jgi:hypothetical protein